ncbi:mandelate racemase/muconate lactonizing enzyme family protein [Sphingomonas sp.]|uniref:mandelate racemase/muconate lactonizing enzyme family protein n=1 Tax=Sphingomonas sp. TaxID=28214 RepID=UPI0025FD2013|nr:mandelate racemase/muconate lactonizing enzyme family protein [Sphingomonas sp.]
MTRITAIETLRLAEHPNVLWVHVESDDGAKGLGETYFMPRAVEAYIHEWAAPRLIGQKLDSIERLVRTLRPYLGNRSAGVEMRGNSAIDIALWDLMSRLDGKPLVDMLGGRMRDTLRIYNTCAGPAYMRGATGQRSANWGLGAGGDYDDLNAFLTRAGDLAESLLDEGITAMKIWPFDQAAEAHDGFDIAPDELRAALEPFEAIRARVGDRIDIMVEFHSLWTLPPALKIARALAPFATYWHEDPVRTDNLSDLRRYAEASPAPVCASETLAGVAGFRDLLETGAAGIVMPDLSWCGGLGEARKIAILADAWRLPIAPHDCTGPVVLAASTHLGLASPNALIQETVRAYYRGWYRDVVTAVPPIADGRIGVPDGPGLGLELDPDLARKFTLTRQRTDKEGHQCL